jgi:hypothetical protein
MRRLISAVGVLGSVPTSGSAPGGCLARDACPGSGLAARRGGRGGGAGDPGEGLRVDKPILLAMLTEEDRRRDRSLRLLGGLLLVDPPSDPREGGDPG